ncbi:MAG TPA: hypothetical protein VF881_05320 [Polyangiaceae bacterium]
MKPGRFRERRAVALASLAVLGSACGGNDAGTTAEPSAQDTEPLRGPQTLAPFHRAPAGDRPTSRSVDIGGVNGAILPNGRLLTPAGVEVNVTARFSSPSARG